MTWLVDNWFLVIGLAALIYVGGYAISVYLNMPTSQQIANMKEWLKYAVTEAERELGSGTGQLKLRMVYNMAVERFPDLIKLIEFNTFSKWVDDSLEWLNKQLESNKNIERIVKDEE